MNKAAISQHVHGLIMQLSHADDHIAHLEEEMESRVAEKHAIANDLRSSLIMKQGELDKARQDLSQLNELYQAENEQRM